MPHSPAQIAEKFPNGPKPRYQFKALDELGWFVLVAVFVCLLGVAWFSQRPLYRPAIAESTTERSAMDSNILCPIRERLSSSGVGNSPSIATVSALLLPISPPTIPWGIRSVIVDPVYAVSGRRSLAHVVQEALKRFPFRANRDPSPTVMSVPRRLRVSTTIAHGLPDAILGSQVHTVGLEPRGTTLSRQITGQAPARFDSARPEIMTSDDALSSAIASTSPLNVLPPSLCDLLNDSQAAKPFAKTESDTISGHRDVSLTRNRGASSALFTAATGHLRVQILPHLTR